MALVTVSCIFHEVPFFKFFLPLFSREIIELFKHLMKCFIYIKDEPARVETEITSYFPERFDMRVLKRPLVGLYGVYKDFFWLVDCEWMVPCR